MFGTILLFRSQDAIQLGVRPREHSFHHMRPCVRPGPDTHTTNRTFPQPFTGSGKWYRALDHISTPVSPQNSGTRGGHKGRRDRVAGLALVMIVRKIRPSPTRMARVGRLDSGPRVIRCQWRPANVHCIGRGKGKREKGKVQLRTPVPASSRHSHWTRDMLSENHHSLLCMQILPGPVFRGESLHVRRPVGCPIGEPQRGPACGR